jgi:hypothetical protein
MEVKSGLALRFSLTCPSVFLIEVIVAVGWEHHRTAAIGPDQSSTSVLEVATNGFEQVRHETFDLGQLGPCHRGQLASVGSRVWFADGAGGKVDDGAAGVRVDPPAQLAHDHHLDSGLLKHFAARGRRRCLAGLDLAAGERPRRDVIMSLSDEHAARSGDDRDHDLAHASQDAGSPLLSRAIPRSGCKTVCHQLPREALALYLE